MKIGYLGPPGSYSYEMACRYVSEARIEDNLIAMPSFSAVIDGVEQGQLDNGIIPIENSTYGAVAPVMDMLINLRNSRICGEMVLDIEHCLLSVSNNIEDIKYVFSHEQALEQCRGFFSSKYPYIELIHCSSTSKACEMARKNGNAYGAVASRAAAPLYDLAVAAQNIQDNAYNQTRFLLIGDQNTEPSGRDKTSLVFAFHDDCPGSLFNVLKAFASRNVNLTRIESRPAKHIMGQYIFYIDFIGHVKDEISIDIMQEIAGQVSWLKVLGSYPVGNGKKEEPEGDQTCCVF